MGEPTRIPAVFTSATVEELTGQLATAGPDQIFVVPAGVLGEWRATFAAPFNSPRRPPPPPRTWIRPAEALERIPIGATKLNRMLATGEVVSKLVGGCRLIYEPSLAAIGDPHARLKRGRPRKAAAPPPSPAPPARPRGRSREYDEYGAHTTA